MKIIIILAIMLTSVVSCNKYNYQISDNCYTVYKITTHRQHRIMSYEIYAQKGGIRYKILTYDEKPNTGVIIKPGGCYNFKLESRIEFFDRKFGPKPNGYYRSMGCTKKTMREIKNRKIKNIYYPSNIKGLYYIEQ